MKLELVKVCDYRLQCLKETAKKTLKATKKASSPERSFTHLPRPARPSDYSKAGVR